MCQPWTTSRQNAVHEPHDDRAVRVLPDNVRLRVVVYVHDPRDTPDRRDGLAVEKQCAAQEAGTVHEPHDQIAVLVAEEQIRLAIVVEVGDASHAPDTPGIR